MKTQKELNDYQHLFVTDLNVLSQSKEKGIMWIEQSDFGDLLIEKHEIGNERFKLWRNLDENIAQGEAKIQIEHAGAFNRYVWETVFECD